ncbi:MAG: nicotinate-nucleotide diphosphorylase (carboxylating), partial [Planctomycetota bacterium]
YAVACGGGGTHRMGLYDAVLVKDNHLAHVPESEWTAALSAMAARARREVPGLKFVMVEVDTSAQLERVLAVPAGTLDLVLLDNMGFDALREAVALRDRVAPGVRLEASGGVTLETVRAIAETGVDRVSVGALTHSSVNLDLGLDIAGLSAGEGQTA